MLKKYMAEKDKELLTNDVREFRRRRMQHWFEKFGGDERAQKMISTLKSLYEGADKGIAFVQKEKRREMNTDEWSDDGSDEAQGSSPTGEFVPGAPGGPEKAASASGKSSRKVSVGGKGRAATATPSPASSPIQKSQQSPAGSPVASTSFRSVVMQAIQARRPSNQ